MVKRKFREKPAPDEKRICSLLEQVEQMAYQVAHPEQEFENEIEPAVAAGVMAHTLIMIIAELTVEQRA